MVAAENAGFTLEKLVFREKSSKAQAQSLAGRAFSRSFKLKARNLAQKARSF
jgi:hypothetical protein